MRTVNCHLTDDTELFHFWFSMLFCFYTLMMKNWFVYGTFSSMRTDSYNYIQSNKIHLFYYSEYDFILDFYIFYRNWFSNFISFNRALKRKKEERSLWKILFDVCVLAWKSGDLFSLWFWVRININWSRICNFYYWNSFSSEGFVCWVSAPCFSCGGVAVCSVADVMFSWAF